MSALLHIGEAALTRVRTIETLEDAYRAWAELRLQHAASLVRISEERRQLHEQGNFLMGAARAASGEFSGASAPGETALAESGALERYLADAESRLSAARRELDARADGEAEGYAAAFAQIRSTLRERIERFLTTVRPKLHLFLRPAGPGRKILHLARVSGDAPVLLLYLFGRRIPSRYDFLFDDSTDEVGLPPPPLYAEEGVESADIRPTAAALRARVEAQGEVLPAKGFLPVFVPIDGGEAFYRLLQRGPVLEVEIQDGEHFRHLLFEVEAERFAGHLLRLKLEGKLELELEAG
ncbi:MAG: hypothetical protein ACOZIN_21450 [Myxococcota bacterium]